MPECVEVLLPDVLVGDADHVANELADGVLEAGDRSHNIRNRVHLK